MRLSSAKAVVLLTLLAPLPLLARTTFDPEYLACMQHALAAREDALLSTLETFNRGVEDLLRQRRDRYYAAWAIADDGDRNDALRDADREYREQERDLRQARREIDRDTKEAYTELKRDCRETYRDRDDRYRDDDRRFFDVQL